MRIAARFRDEQLIARLLAPPDLGEGIESLRYWRERRKRLPWYRVAARREAAQMAMRWERRVGAALLAQRGVPFAARVSAGLLVVHGRARRWIRRATIALTATLVIGLALAVTAIASLLHSL